MYTDFTSKLLYRQTASSEEGHEVISAVYGLAWRHPSSTANITTRVRMTIVCNFVDPNLSNIVAANIELWKENGWITFEDLFDEAFSANCYSSREIEGKCLHMLEMFFVGKVDDDRPQPFDTGPGAPKRKKGVKPNIPDSIKPKADKNPVKPSPASPTTDEITNNEKKKKPEPDFEWI